MSIIDTEAWLRRFKDHDWSQPGMAPQVFRIAFPEHADRLQRAIDRAEIGPGSSFHAEVLLERHPDTGEVLVFSFAVGPIDYPEHTHGSDVQVHGAEYGERYWTLQGRIYDVRDGGHPFIHSPWMDPVTHAVGTTHQPRVDRFWVGVFHQPAGSRLVAAST